MKVRVHYMQVTTRTWSVVTNVKPNTKLENIVQDIVGEVPEDAVLDEHTEWTKMEVLPDPTELSL